jgi:hypothetical protein
VLLSFNVNFSNIQYVCLSMMIFKSDVIIYQIEGDLSTLPINEERYVIFIGLRIRISTFLHFLLIDGVLGNLVMVTIVYFR